LEVVTDRRDQETGPESAPATDLGDPALATDPLVRVSAMVTAPEGQAAAIAPAWEIGPAVQV
jgi:hypothetical protein